MDGAASLPVLLAKRSSTSRGSRTAPPSTVASPGRCCSGLLRVIPGEGITLAELPAAARISRRIVKAWLGLEKQGWLTVEPGGPGDQGRSAHVPEVQRVWRARVGPGRGRPTAPGAQDRRRRA